MRKTKKIQANQNQIDRSKLSDYLAASVPREDRILLAKILDRAEQSQSRNIPVSTDFLSPSQLAEARILLRLAGISENAYAILGGYHHAERNLLLFIPDWLDHSDSAAIQAQAPIRFLRAKFRPEDQISHRDLLGSLMALGIVREKTGDILVSPDSADCIILDSIESFLLQNWTTAGRTKLHITRIQSWEIQVPEASIREIRDTVQTLRLDAIFSSGFRMSRGKASDFIRSGRVQVNWLPCIKPDRILSEGDVISARGLGKFKLQSIGGTTKKGRIAINIQVYGK